MVVFFTSNPLFLAVLGAFLGALFQWLLSRNQGPATSATPISISYVVNYVSRSTTVETVEWKEKIVSSTQSDEDNVWLFVLGGLAATILVATFYAVHQRVILQVIIGLTAFIASANIAAILYMRLTGMRLTSSWDGLLVAYFLFLLIGPANVYLLLHPYYRNGRYDELIIALKSAGSGGVKGQYGLEGMMFVFYQCVGVLFFGAMLLVLLGGLIFLYSALNAVRGSFPSKFWLWLARRMRFVRPKIVAGLAGVLALVSLLLTSGLLYNTIDRAHTPPPGSTSPSPSDAPAGRAEVSP